MEHIHLLSSVDHRNRWTIYTTARWTNSRRLFSQASVLESRWISKKQRTLRSRIPQHHLKSHDINPMKSHEIPWNPMKSHEIIPPRIQWKSHRNPMHSSPRNLLREAAVDADLAAMVRSCVEAMARAPGVEKVLFTHRSNGSNHGMWKDEKMGFFYVHGVFIGYWWDFAGFYAIWTRSNDFFWFFQDFMGFQWKLNGI